MKKPLSIFAIALLLPVLLAPGNGNGNGNGNNGNHNGNGNGNVKGRVRGQENGGFDLIVGGFYSGTGKATVTNATVSFDATVRVPGRGSAVLSCPSLALTSSRFVGAATIDGIPCTLEGRVDLPSATDDEESDDQAITARITATLKDARGHMARLVAIQQPASRGPKK